MTFWGGFGLGIAVTAVVAMIISVLYMEEHK